MAARVREEATYEDLIKVPENMVAELIEGELYTAPRPAGPHTNAASALMMLIGPPFHFGNGGPGGWWIQFEPEVHFGRNVLVPDLAGWRRERMPELPQNHIYAISPDWVCEVLSHSTARIDRAKKLPIHARGGVAYAWIVDVEGQYLEVKRRADDSWLDVTTFGGEEKVRAEPFEAIEMDMTLVWGPPPS